MSMLPKHCACSPLSPTAGPVGTFNKLSHCGVPTLPGCAEPALSRCTGAGPAPFGYVGAQRFKVNIDVSSSQMNLRPTHQDKRFSHTVLTI